MSFSSIAGIGLGSFVLIMLLSVMNGFEKELKSTLLSVIPHGEIFSVSNEGIENWQELKSRIESDSKVSFATPYTQITGLLQNKAELKPVSLSGLEYDENVTNMLSIAVDDSAFSLLKERPFGIILGQSIAQQIDVGINDTVEFLIPQSNQGNRFSAPKKVQFEVVGFLHMGGEVDAKLGLINLKTASDLLGIQSGAQGIRLSLIDPFEASQVVRKYGYELAQPVYMSDWTRTHGHIFQDIQLVRMVVYVVLTLVIAVACFNVVSTLVMGVRAKQASIAILVSMGATDSFIRRIFLYQGLTNGLIGTFIGVAAALLIVPNVSTIVAWIESLLNMKLLSSDVYFIDFLPTSLEWLDVVFTVIISLIMSTIAAYYPARRAARIKPASVLS